MGFVCLNPDCEPRVSIFFVCIVTGIDNSVGSENIFVVHYVEHTIWRLGNLWIEGRAKELAPDAHEKRSLPNSVIAPHSNDALEWGSWR